MRVIFYFWLIFTLTSCAGPEVKPPLKLEPDRLLEVRKIDREDTFFWGISADLKKLPGGYDVYGLDGFDTPHHAIAALRAQGKKTICYMSAHFENWRPDAEEFPKDMTVERLGNWSGEYILDVSKSDQFIHIMDNRARLCRQKGFDAIEWDNLDQKHKRGSLLDVIAYVKRLVAISGQSGLPVFFKNFGLHVKEFQPLTAGVIVESCNVYKECDLYKPFWDADKPVYMIEYDKRFFNKKSWGKTYLAPKNRILDGSRWE